MKKSAKCPICGKPTQPATRPFCSKRCADIDLGRWLGDVYRVPGEETSPPAGAGRPDEDEE
jgi:uncharacterized protein